jgi:SOS-response transcriptional repressor LexA
MKKITARRKSVLDFIRVYIKVHGVSPSYEVIARGLGLKAKSNAHRIVRRLELDGYLAVSPRKFYGIVLRGKHDTSVRDIISL